MPVENRVRVDIFVPVRREDPAYPAVVDWLKYWLAYIHGGVTLSGSTPTVFTGYYRNPEQPDEIIEDEIVWITVDIPVPPPALASLLISTVVGTTVSGAFSSAAKDFSGH